MAAVAATAVAVAVAVAAAAQPIDIVVVVNLLSRSTAAGKRSWVAVPTSLFCHAVTA